jgi:hypothetical protein
MAPDRPPQLVPGWSAHGWNLLGFAALLLLIASIVPWLWLSVHPELLLLTAIAIAFYAFAIFGYRRAAFRERAAGYTTTPGDYAEFTLPGKGATPVRRLFPISNLWRLDPKTGAVVRPPGSPPDPDRTGWGIL